MENNQQLWASPRTTLLGLPCLDVLSPFLSDSVSRPARFRPQVDASVLSIAHGDFERGLIQGFQETARVGLQAHQQEASHLSCGEGCFE